MRATTIGNPNAFAHRYALRKFHVTVFFFFWPIDKPRAIRLLGIEGQNARDQIAFFVSHSFLVEVQTNAGYLHATHA